MNRYFLLIVVPLLAFQAASATSSFSVPAYTEEKQKTWNLQISSFLWAATVNGKISPFKHGNTIEVKKSFPDVISDFDMGSFMHIWARRERMVLYANIMHVHGKKRETYNNLSALQVLGKPVIIPPGANIISRANNTQLTATMMAGYRIMDIDNYTLDLLGGGALLVHK